jgi:FdhD protein
MILSTLISRMALSSTILLTTRMIDIESITPTDRIAKSDLVAMETCLKISLNGPPVAKVSCSPGLERELAIGFLITGRLIAGYHVIKSCRTSGDSCRVTTVGRTESAFRHKAPLRVVSFRTVADAVDSLLQEQQAHSATGGTHAALVKDPHSGWAVSVEDVSRTSALCKAIGAAAVRGVDLAGCLAATTGRLTAELVRRSANSGVPLLASRAVATDLGVKLAADRGLTLLGAVGKGRSWLYNEGTCRLDLDS